MIGHVTGSRDHTRDPTWPSLLRLSQPAMVAGPVACTWPAMATGLRPRQVDVPGRPPFLAGVEEVWGGGGVKRREGAVDEDSFFEDTAAARRRGGGPNTKMTA